MKRIAFFLTIAVLFLPSLESIAGNSRDRGTSVYEISLDNGISLKIDERVELVSIAFRLAGAEEYVTDWMPEYMDEIDVYFERHKDHDLVSFIRRIRRDYNFGYGIAAKSSFMIDIVKGRVQVCKDWDIRKEFTEEYSQCWTEDIFLEYVKLLDRFYRDTRFHSFFSSHSEFYEKAVQNNRKLPSYVNMQWFEDFFGYAVPGVDLYMGLCTGSSNYSIHEISHKTDWNGRLAIIVGASSAHDGAPKIMEFQFPVIIHEISHYYTNPLTDRYYVEMEKSMDFVFSKVEKEMSAIGYGDARTVTGEWLNELFTNMYLKDEFESGKPLSSYRYNVVQDEADGYIWMSRAISFMENFYLYKEDYPTVGHFMPQLVAFTCSLPEKWDIIEKEFASRKPYVVYVFPGGETISKDTENIRIKFSKPMTEGIQGLLKIDGYEMLPFDFEKCHWENDTVFIIALGELNAGKTYGVRLPSNVYFSKEFYTIDNYDIIIKTE